MDFNIYAAFNLFSIIQGVILALILTFNKKYASKSVIYIILLLLICVSLNLMGLIDEFFPFEENPILWFIPIRFYTLLPPAMYFCIYFNLNPNYKIKKWEYALYLPFIIDFTHQCYATFLHLIGALDHYEKGYWGVHYFIIMFFEMGTGILFILVAYKLIVRLKAHKKSLYDQYSDLDQKNVQWIINTILVGGLVVALWFALNLLKINSLLNLDQRGVLWIGITIIIYWIGYGLILRPKVFIMNNEGITPVKDEGIVEIKNQLTIIPTETKIIKVPKLSENTDEYHDQLIYLMEEKALYRDPEFNMDQLSEELKLSKGYLSQIINQKEGKNFFEFINHYRVEDVKKKLRSASYSHFSILAIGHEAGFKSKSSFYSAFKKQTGTSPSKFREKVN